VPNHQVRYAFPAADLLRAFSQRVVEVFIAETGGNMSVFPPAVTWRPGLHQSRIPRVRRQSEIDQDPRRQPQRCPRTAALAASHSRATYVAAKYWRIAARCGPMKAIAALEHCVLIAPGERSPTVPSC